MTDENDNRTPTPRRVLPVVADMCRRVDRVFVRYVGPVAYEITKQIYEQWLAQGNTGPSGVSRYIRSLSRQVVDEHQRNAFLRDARNAMMEALKRRSQ